MKILSLRIGDKNIVRVNSNVFVEWGEKESIKEFVCDLRRGGRHWYVKGLFSIATLYRALLPGFRQGIFG